MLMNSTSKRISTPKELNKRMSNGNSHSESDAKRESILKKRQNFGKKKTTAMDEHSFEMNDEIKVVNRGPSPTLSATDENDKQLPEKRSHKLLASLEDEPMTINTKRRKNEDDERMEESKSHVSKSSNYLKVNNNVPLISK